MITVAFQGTFGAYGHEAINRYFNKQARPLGFELSEQVMEAVLTGAVDQGILPIENSIVGNVAINSDLINLYPVSIVGEYYLGIRHTLLGLKGAKLSQIKEVHSHPIALAQCRFFLEKHKIKAIPAYDTAGSSALLHEWGDIEIAAISSELCSELYDLEVLSKDIQQVETNFTRFVVFSSNEKLIVPLKTEKTSLAFQTKHQPGALLECLKIFADYKLNLTKLESRPIPENPFQYIFFVDFLGDVNATEVQKGLAKLRQEALTVKILGSYPMAVDFQKS